MVREVVFGVGFALILPIFFGLDGVLYPMPISDILTFLLSAAAIVYTYRTLYEVGNEKIDNGKDTATTLPEKVGMSV